MPNASSTSASAADPGTPGVPVTTPVEPGEAPSLPRVRRGFRPRRGATRAHPTLLLFPLPALVIYVIFFAIPTVQAVQYAITDWDGFSATFENVGTENFR